MGEAVYYGKIRFETVEEAEMAYPEIKALVEETYYAGNYWQENRGKADREAFWRGMEAEFPKASEYLKSCSAQLGEQGVLWGGDHNNGLAGLLDLIDCEEDIEDVQLFDRFITWSSLVWHFADWEPFREFIEGRYKCQMRWLSDEYLDIGVLLDAEFED